MKTWKDPELNAQREIELLPVPLWVSGYVQAIAYQPPDRCPYCRAFPSMPCVLHENER